MKISNKIWGVDVTKMFKLPLYINVMLKGNEITNGF